MLRAYGWGPLLNLGWFRFRRPFTLLNLIFTSLVFMPRLRLPAAQLGLVKRSIRLLAPDRESSVLDVACGRGATSFTVANTHPQTQVVGMDLLPESIEVARTLYGNAPNLSYCQGDATKLEFADESFDRLLCLEAAFHFPDRAAFLAEARRVLRPGGLALIVDFMSHDDADPAIWESDEATTVRQTWQFERFGSLAEYRANAAAAGLDVLEARDWSAHVTEPIQSLFNLVAWLGGRRWGQRVMTIQNPMLRSLSDDDWRAFDRAAKAHKRIRASSSYTALLLTPSVTP